jgi:hypothetical protein
MINKKGPLIKKMTLKNKQEEFNEHTLHKSMSKIKNSKIIKKL